jgi:hypothetical protein
VGSSNEAHQYTTAYNQEATRQEKKGTSHLIAWKSKILNLPLKAVDDNYNGGQAATVTACEVSGSREQEREAHTRGEILVKNKFDNAQVLAEE